MLALSFRFSSGGGRLWVFCTYSNVYQLSMKPAVEEEKIITKPTSGPWWCRWRRTEQSQLQLKWMDVVIEDADYYKMWQNPTTWTLGSSALTVVYVSLLPVCKVEYITLSLQRGFVRQINLQEALRALHDDHHREAQKEMNNSVFSSVFEWCAWVRPRDTHTEK